MMVAERVGVRALVVASLALVGALALTACSPSSPEHERDAAVYESIVRWLMDRDIPPPDEPPLHLFFEELGNETIPLEVQVELIERLEEDANVRFIDAREEAVDADDPAMPVHDGGALVGLGAVPADGPPSVRVDVYRSVEQASAYRFELSGSGANWRISGEPELLPPEDLMIDDEGG